MNADFWLDRDVDLPYTINGFNGTWAFSDHSLVPDTLHNFLLEYFHAQTEKNVFRIRAIPLEDINRVMNELWEGPGSMVKLTKLANEMKATRLATED